MSTCLFVTGILYLAPDPLLESDDKVIIKPMSRDASNSEMEYALYIFQRLWDSSNLG